MNRILACIVLTTCLTLYTALEAHADPPMGDTGGDTGDTGEPDGAMGDTGDAGDTGEPAEEPEGDLDQWYELTPVSTLTGGTVIDIEADYGISGNISIELTNTIEFGYVVNLWDSDWHRSPAGEEMIDPTVGGTRSTGALYETIEIRPTLRHTSGGVTTTFALGIGTPIGSATLGPISGTTSTITIPRFIIAEVVGNTVVIMQIEADRGHPTDTLIEKDTVRAGITVKEMCETMLAEVVVANTVLDELVAEGEVDPARYDTEGYNAEVLEKIRDRFSRYSLDQQADTGIRFWYGPLN